MYFFNDFMSKNIVKRPTIDTSIRNSALPNSLTLKFFTLVLMWPYRTMKYCHIHSFDNPGWTVAVPYLPSRDSCKSKSTLDTILQQILR